MSLTLSEHYILETNLKFLVSEDLRWLKLILFYVPMIWIAVSVARRKRSMHLPVHFKDGGHKAKLQIGCLQFLLLKFNHDFQFF